MPYIPTMPKNRRLIAITLGFLVCRQAWAQLPAPGGNPVVGSAQPGSSGVPAQGSGTPGFPNPSTAPTFGAPSAPGTTPIAPEAPPTDAEKTIDAAVAKVKALVSVSADITQSVSLLGEKFEVTGQYHKASNYRVYLKLSVAGYGDTPATTLQVCDGGTLWDFSQVLDSQTYRKLTIGNIVKKLQDPVLSADIRDQVMTNIGFAGPEALLIGLRKSVRFDQKADSKLGDVPVWVVRGQWKDREGLVGPNNQPLPPTAPLPPYIPSNVSIWLGQADGWPYKVEMYGTVPSRLAAVEPARQLDINGRPSGVRTPPPQVDPSRVILQYANVKLNPALRPETFAFQAPPDAKGVVDGTEELLALLDQAIQSETARRKTEAAKGEPLLNEPINVPKSAPDPLSPSGGAVPGLPPTPR